MQYLKIFLSLPLSYQITFLLPKSKMVKMQMTYYDRVQLRKRQMLLQLCCRAVSHIQQDSFARCFQQIARTGTICSVLRQYIEAQRTPN